MRIDPIQLNTQNKLINDYRNNKSMIMQHFDYSPSQDYTKRVNDLKSRTYKREQLTEVLHTLNRKWNAPDATHHNIERLKNEDSVVVIGGQQAGLMTGPLYTINKIISIIQLAKQQEEELEIPVIPVFWIAGEDHDFAEINHVFLPEDGEMKKHKLFQRVNEKHSVSNIQIDEMAAEQWVDLVFEQLEETAYTKQLYEVVMECLHESSSYVDFFAHIIYRLFDEEGLVLVDSGDHSVRQLESDYFVSFIEKQPEITNGVYASYQQLIQSDYVLPLDVNPDDAHLFYHLNGERILLMRKENGEWIGKQNEVVLTTDELLTIAKNNPELLSNNVVTRPIMQELLFPTLAFIGGNGEISYWSILKPAFRTLGLKMPLVVPRLSFTYIGYNADKLLKKYAISDARVVADGVADIKRQWLEAKNTPPIEQIANDMRAEIARVHEPLREIAREMRSDLEDLAGKNLYYLQSDIDYLKRRLMQAEEQKYTKELGEFDRVQNILRPKDGLQERTWNPLPLINEYGTDFIKAIIDEPCSFAKEHFLVYI